MLATPELIREAAQFGRVEKLLPRWREFPIYQRTPPENDFFRLPLIGKRELRENFPDNFLRAGQRLDALLERQIRGIGAHVRLLGGADGGAVRSRLVERAGGAGAAAESFCRSGSGRKSPRPPRRDCAARLQRPRLLFQLHLQIRAHGGHDAVCEPGAHSVFADGSGTRPDGWRNSGVVAAVSGFGSGAWRVVRAVSASGAASGFRRCNSSYAATNL